VAKLETSDYHNRGHGLLQMIQAALMFICRPLFFITTA